MTKLLRFCHRQGQTVYVKNFHVQQLILNISFCLYRVQISNEQTHAGQEFTLITQFIELLVLIIMTSATF